MSWIEWCKCHRRILTTGQMKDNKPCDICQEEQKQGAPRQEFYEIADNFNG